MTEEMSDRIAEMCGRAEMYRLLASVFYRELDDEQIATLKAAPLAAPEEGPMKAASEAIYRSFRLAPPDVLTRLRVDYARIFLAAGVYEGDTAVPFESCSPTRRATSWARPASRWWPSSAPRR